MTEPTEKPAAQTESAKADSVQRVVRAHPWRTYGLNYQKLKTARHEAAKRRSLKYRHENLEERRAMERNWHRKKLGIDLEAPVMTKAAAAAKARAVRAAKRPNARTERRLENL
jgi:hypothetical protein